MIKITHKYMAILLATVTASVAEIPEGEIKGLMSPLQDKYAYLSPITGLAMLRSNILSHIRFYGNYGPDASDKGFQCHSQIKENRRGTDCPQDYQTTLLQHLFPSPTGRPPLVPNNVDKIIKGLSAESVGDILFFITQIRGSLEAGQKFDKTQVNKAMDQLALTLYGRYNPEGFEKIRLDILGGGQEKKKKLNVTFIMSQLNKTIKNLEEKQDKSSEEMKFFEKLSNIQKEIEKLTTIIKTTTDKTKIPNLQKEKTILFETLDDYFTEKKDTDGDSRLLLEVQKTEDYRKFQELLTLIVNALQENIRTLPGDYPPYMVEQTLLAYAWKKAEKKAEFIPFFQALGSSVLKPENYGANHNFIPPKDWTNSFTQKDYDAFKAGLNTDKFNTNKKMPTPEVLQKMFKNPEEAYFQTLSYDTYDNPYPRNISFSTVNFPAFTQEENEKLSEKERKREENSRNYPDCGETSIRNFLNAILYNQKEKIFDVNLLREISPNVDKRLITFFEEQTPGNMESLGDEWSDIVSNLNKGGTGNFKILYDKLKHRGTNKEGECDIMPGMANSLRVICRLLNDGELNKIDTSAEREQERSAKILTRLCMLITKAKQKKDQDFELTWQVEGGGQRILNDKSTTIELLINDEVTFRWQFTSGHFDFDFIKSDEGNDWRKSKDPLIWESIRNAMGIDMNMHNSSLELLMPFYMEPDYAQNFLKSLQSSWLENRRVSSLVYSFSLSDSSGILPAIKMILTYKANEKGLDAHSSLVQVMGNRWIDAIPNDPVTNRSLFDLLYPVKNSLTESLGNKMKNLQDIIVKDPNLYIFSAIKNGDVFLLEMLIENKANLKVMGNDGANPLHEAVKFGNLEMVTLLLNKAPELLENDFVKDGSGDTPLHLAVRWRIKSKESELETVRLLLNASPDLQKEYNTPNKNGDTRLQAQIKSGNLALEIVKALLNVSPDLQKNLNAQNEKRDTPLHEAVKSGNLEMVTLFIEKAPELVKNDLVKDKDDNTTLHLAASFGCLEMVKFLIGTNSSLLSADFIKDGNGDTPLHLAAISGNLEIVKLLVEKNPDLLKGDLVRDNAGNTPVRGAIVSKHPEIVKFLADKAPELFKGDFATDKNGNTLLHLAVSSGNLEIVAFLVKEFPDLVKNGLGRNTYGKTPLHLAVSSRNLEMVTLLMEKMPDLMRVDLVRDKDGKTPLQQAVSSGNLEMVKLLMEKFPNLVKGDFLRDENERTPLHLAASSGNLEMVTFLIEKMPGLLEGELVKDKYGKTPLHLAALKGSLDIINALLLAKPQLLEEPLVRDSQGNTPLHGAVSGGQLNVVVELVKIKPELKKVKNNKNETPLDDAKANRRRDIVRFLSD